MRTTLEEISTKLNELDGELLIETQTDRNLGDLCDIVLALTAVVETQQRHIEVLRKDLAE